MKSNPIQIDCELRVRGTHEANASVHQDLLIPDPEKEEALAILAKAVEGQSGQKRIIEKSISDHPKDS